MWTIIIALIILGAGVFLLVEAGANRLARWGGYLLIGLGVILLVVAVNELDAEATAALLTR
jgi:divalent metal cation (Fe/Co/Zn/Cd) transporter